MPALWHLLGQNNGKKLKCLPNHTVFLYDVNVQENTRSLYDQNYCRRNVDIFQGVGAKKFLNMSVRLLKSYWSPMRMCLLLLEIQRNIEIKEVVKRV